MSKIKIIAKSAGDLITVKTLMKHPMESGVGKDKMGRTIPAHFIQEVVVENNGVPVLTAHFSAAVSKNPYLSTKIPGRSGDEIAISWRDNQGNTDKASVSAR